jgi:hypothetical protein
VPAARSTTASVWAEDKAGGREFGSVAISGFTVAVEA